MNGYINAQIQNMKFMVQTFEQSCKLAVTKDDGKIDRDEEKTLKKISTASQKFLKELESIK